MFIGKDVLDIIYFNLYFWDHERRFEKCL